MKQVNFRLTDEQHATLVTMAASVKMTAPGLALALVQAELETEGKGGYIDLLFCEHDYNCRQLKAGRSDYCLAHATIPRCVQRYCSRPVAALGADCGRHTEDEENDL